MTPRVVGLVGRKQSGKDTFAARLVAAHGFRRYAFADALKNVALATDPVIPFKGRLSQLVDDIGWDRAKLDYPEVRRFLQHLGTAVRDHLDADAWTRHVEERVRTADQPAVITDVRFPNEVDVIRRLGGILVRVHRPAPADTVDADELAARRHISETALDGLATDWAVRNVGTIAHLHAAVDRFAVAIQSQ